MSRAFQGNVTRALRKDSDEQERGSSFVVVELETSVTSDVAPVYSKDDEDCLRFQFIAPRETLWPTYIGILCIMEPRSRNVLATAIRKRRLEIRGRESLTRL